MPLTDPQKAALKADMSNPANVEAFALFDAGNASGLVAYYNAPASPAFTVWGATEASSGGVLRSTKYQTSDPTSASTAAAPAIGTIGMLGRLKPPRFALGFPFALPLPDALPAGRAAGLGAGRSDGNSSSAGSRSTGIDGRSDV